MLGNLFNIKYRNEDEEKNKQQTPVPPAPSTQSVPSAPSQPASAGQQQVPVAPISSPSASTDNLVGSSMQPDQRQDLSIMSHLDTRTVQVLNQAQQETKRIKQALIEPEQLLIGLLFDSDVFKLMGKFSVDVAKLSQELQGKEQLGTFEGQPTLSENSKHLFEEAYSMVKSRGVEFISPEDLLVAIFSQNIAVSDFLKTQGLDKDKIGKELSKTSTFVYGKKSTLEQFGIDLTEQAKSGELDPITGRDREVERLAHILLRRSKNNPIIIGEAGVGKTAIVEGLAQDIISGKAPKDLQTKKIIQLDLSSLVAGASHRGEFEERLRSVIKETQAAGNIILFIDEIHTIIGAGDTEGALDASNIIKPFLARGQLQIIGTTTTAEFRKYFEKDKAFERRFQPVIADEPSEEAAIEMMKVLAPKYEAFHKVVVTPDAIEAAVKLSKRYIGERYLPDKAIDLLDEACAQVRLELNEGKKQGNQIVREDIENIVSSWTGIPITKLTENESEKLLHLEDTIHKRLINQENAVTLVAEAVRRGRIGLSSVSRPIASFIFLGPTGVGKTELAKTLAEVLFGKEDAMIRIDMSEYMEKHEVAKLIGAPPGYVGYEEGGQLTEAVRAKPYSIVLFDEVEKAHPDVFNILLQLLEDGRLTDNKGNTISFKNTIIIATSNIGSALIQQQLQDAGKAAVKEAAEAEGAEGAETAVKPTDELAGAVDETVDKVTVKTAAEAEVGEQPGQPKPQTSSKEKLEELNKILMGELRKFFRPELLNRFDGLVVFEPLSEKNMMAVAKLGISSTRKLLLLQGIDLEASEVALSRLAKEGYDPIYGARPLRRLIQTAIENPIALLMINKTFISGDKILIDFDAQTEEFKFTKAIPAPQSAQAQPGAGVAPVPGIPPTNGQSIQGETSAPSAPQPSANGVIQQPSTQGVQSAPLAPVDLSGQGLQVQAASSDSSLPPQANVV
jgi:ATP-dependent Clp protease ATP-binding subunit ClpC